MSYTKYQTTQMISLDYVSTFELGPFSANKGIASLIVPFKTAEHMHNLKVCKTLVHAMKIHLRYFLQGDIQ